MAVSLHITYDFNVMTGVACVALAPCHLFT
jgi:hypothetical protein